MPLPGKRHFSLTIPGSPTGGPDGKNRGVYHDDLFSGEIGQVGTQLDGLGHVGVRIGGDDYFYNGFKRSEFGTAYGLTKLGIENVGVFFTRGVLLDVAGAARASQRMKPGEVITVGRPGGGLKQAGRGVGDGRRRADPHRARPALDEGQRGVRRGRAGHRAWPRAAGSATEDRAGRLRHLGDRGRAAPRTRTGPFQVHQLLLVRHGIYNLENLDLEELAARQGLRVRVHLRPVAPEGRDRLAGQPDRRAVTWREIAHR